MPLQVSSCFPVLRLCLVIKIFFTSHAKDKDGLTVFNDMCTFSGRFEGDHNRRSKLKCLVPPKM